MYYRARNFCVEKPVRMQVTFSWINFKTLPCMWIFIQLDMFQTPMPWRYLRFVKEVVFFSFAIFRNFPYKSRQYWLNTDRWQVWSHYFICLYIVINWPIVIIVSFAWILSYMYMYIIFNVDVLKNKTHNDLILTELNRKNIVMLINLTIKVRILIRDSRKL